MPERTHYETLGLPETASQDEIKKQYRSLARKYHPDVNSGKEAAQQFSAIAEAYRILNDAESRRAYDSERALRQRQANIKPTGPLNHPASPRPGAPPSSPPPATTATQEADRLVQQAQVAFTRGRLAEARSLAEQALRYNRRNATGWEILGDVCRNQGRSDDALRHYTMASQHDPRSATVQQKIERIARQPSGGSSGSNGYTPRTQSQPPPPRQSSHPVGRTAPLAANLSEDKRPLARLLAGFFGYFGAFLILLFAGLYLDKTAQATNVLPFVKSWSWAYVGCLAVAGALIGGAMTITGAIRRIEDDLILTGVGGARTPPLGLLVIVLGLIFFWAAAAIHLAIALIQEALTPSLLRLYGVIAFVTALFAICWSTPSNGGAGQTLLLGGNIIFIGFIVGWLLGDFFRAD